MSKKSSSGSRSKDQEPADKKFEELSEAYAIIISCYLQNYIPAEEYGPGVTIMTTDEIVAALSEMADVSHSLVIRCLTTLGFRPGYNNAGSFGWLMKRAGN